MKTYKAIGLTALICIILTSSLWYVFGATPTSSIWISNGLYPSAVSYTVWKEGSNYFAKDGYGHIQYDNSNFTAIMENVVSSIGSDGGNIYLPSPSYTVTHTINITSKITLYGANKQTTLTLANNADCDILNLWYAHDCIIRDLRLFGNNAYNNLGSGIIIRSPTSFDTFNVIEDVKIENCSRYGIRIYEYPRDNTLKNVYVAYNDYDGVLVESTDNTLIEVESGWSGRNGFYIKGQSNYLLNCVAWGAGWGNHPTECNGIKVINQRHILVSCDADRNDRAGFMLEGANYTSVSACIARNNGQRIAGAWGFNLYDSFYNVISCCQSTDEQGTPTQDIGFIEGGSSDWNLLTSFLATENTDYGISIVGSNTEVHHSLNQTVWIN